MTQQNKEITKDNQDKTPYSLHKKRRANAILAQVIISESELVKVMPDYTSKYECDNAAMFKIILHSLGMDTAQHYERQDGLKHRNRMNEVVVCSRWVGNERLDEQWITSGYASQEAIDKYSGSKILEDLYRSKLQTEDAQAYLADRDKYVVIDESQWE